MIQAEDWLAEEQFCGKRVRSLGRQHANSMPWQKRPTTSWAVLTGSQPVNREK